MATLQVCQVLASSIARNISDPQPIHRRQALASSTSAQPSDQRASEQRTTGRPDAEIRGTRARERVRGESSILTNSSPMFSRSRFQAPIGRKHAEFSVLPIVPSRWSAGIARALCPGRLHKDGADTHPERSFERLSRVQRLQGETNPIAGRTTGSRLEAWAAALEPQGVSSIVTQSTRSHPCFWCSLDEHRSRRVLATSLCRSVHQPVPYTSATRFRRLYLIAPSRTTTLNAGTTPPQAEPTTVRIGRLRHRGHWPPRTRDYETCRVMGERAGASTGIGE
ncbi:hypothetical protein C8F01DRAFT_160603 [Mycena amicta]|nr:hypothetical protein C8F01DRAFT_160603 [Mycena amicta]